MGEKTMPVTGGCLCGAIRYESTEPPDYVVYCHCRICQIACGALFALVAGFPGETFRYTQGEPTYYHSSSWVKRGFCANCGSPVEMTYTQEFHVSDPEPGPGVLIGTLDHPEDWPPDLRHTGIESKVPWHVITDDLPQRRADESNYVQVAKARLRDEAERGN